MKLAVIGGLGRMGKKIIQFAMADPDITVSCAVELKNSPAIGKKIIQFINPEKEKEHGLFCESLEGDIDAVIDFSSPASTMSHMEMAAERSIAYVIGTTGLTGEQNKRVKELSEKIAIVKAPNMSIGVNLLFKVTKDVSRILGPLGYDIEIVELHHNKKKDSPSGTAKYLLDMAAEGSSKKAEDAVYGREGIVGERTKDEIGVMAVRAGDIIGEHTVYFVGNNERIELTHRAHSRDVFARGSIAAAKFISGKKPGLYDMQDVLGMK